MSAPRPTLRFRWWYFRHARHMILFDRYGRIMYCVRCRKVAPVSFDD